MEQTEIKGKKKLPIWAVIVAALVVIAAVVVIVVSISTGSDSNRKVADKLKLADKYMTELNYQQAIAVYDEILKIEPKNEAALSQMVEAYLAWARSEESKGDSESIARAIEILTEGYDKTGSERLLEETNNIMKRAGWLDDIDNGTGTGSNSDPTQKDKKTIKVLKKFATDNGEYTANLVVYEYDEKGRIKSANHGEVLYEYDDEGRITGAQHYDVDGKLTEYCKATELGSDGDGTWKFYNSADTYIGQLKKHPNGEIETEYPWDSDANGVNESEVYNKYDKYGDDIEYKYTENGNVYWWQEYGYNDQGDISTALYHQCEAYAQEATYDYFFYDDGEWIKNLNAPPERLYSATYYHGARDYKTEYFEFDGSGKISYYTVKDYDRMVEGSYGGDGAFLSEYELYPYIEYSEDINGFETDNFSWFLPCEVRRCVLSRDHITFFYGNMFETPLILNYEYDEDGDVTRIWTYLIDKSDYIRTDFEYEYIEVED